MKGKNLYRRIVVIAAVVMAAAGIYLAVRQLEKKFLANPATQKESTEVPDIKETIRGTLKLGGKKYAWTHKMESYLIIGTDASGNASAKGKEYKGTMADFLLVLAVDRTDHTYSMIQLNRDTITEVTLMQTDGSGMASAEEQICTAHWYGGNPIQSCENTVEAVSGLLGGIPFTGYYALNMEDIPVLNRMVGGVTVTIEDDFSKVDPTLIKGSTLKLSDKQAYTYVHDRFDVGDERNISRMKRQRNYMEAFLKQARAEYEKDSGFVMDLYRELKDTTVTDLTGKKISRLAKEFGRSTNQGIYSFEGKERIGQRLGDGIDHAEFFIDDDSRLQILSKIYGLKECETKK